MRAITKITIREEKENVTMFLTYNNDSTEEIKLEGKISTRKQNQIDLVNNRVESEMNRLGDNIWGLLNGFTFYSTHDMKTENSGFGLINGAPAELNQKVFNISNKILKGELVKQC